MNTGSWINTNRTGQYNPYCFKAYDSVGTVLNDAGLIQIDLATEVYDYNNNFATDTYTAPFAGVYHFDGAVTMGTIASGVDFLCYINVNGTTRIEGERRIPISDGTSTVSGDALLAAGDTVTFHAYQNSAGNETTTTGEAKTWFSGHLVHRTA